MTSDSHERCTDRIAEAALYTEAEIVINVQGDEPLVRPAMIEPLIEPLILESSLQCTNLMSEIHDEEEFLSPNVVKTVVDPRMNALYFSREPIPSVKKAQDLPVKKYRQLGIIAFRKDFLKLFSSMPETPLERIESVDMLRALEHGYTVRMVETPFQMVGVDTYDDLQKTISIMKNDDLFKTYK
jgi:3-deoxy-manno-octulosonate cytidylyltransferase (CMP-KDO synthetase)